MQAFRSSDQFTPLQTRRKKRRRKGGATAYSKNLGIWVVKEMTFTCFILS
jgi:hypothetical protein